jgi:hypothetical protein
MHEASGMLAARMVPGSLTTCYTIVFEKTTVEQLFREIHNSPKFITAIKHHPLT